MKLGVFGDIHGNKVALELILYELKEEHDVDELVCTGDIIGVLGWPEETVQLVEEEVDYAVYGNHDAYIRSDYNYVPEHPSQKQEHRVVTSELTEESVEYINQLPDRVDIGDNVVMAHANPYTENKAGYPANGYIDKNEWTKFGGEHMNGQIVLMGHTHDQGALDVGKFEGQSGTIVNPGSAGAPFYEDARYAVVDTETHEVELHRSYFDESELRERFDQLGIVSNPGHDGAPVFDR